MSPTFVCVMCGSKHGNKNESFEYHIRSHINERPHFCTICKAEFKIKHHLKAHVTTHNPERPFKCTLCGACFKTKTILDGHSKTHSQTKFKCEMCKKFYRRAQSLKAHIKVVHEKLKRFQCQICGMKFSRQDILVMHTRQHTGEKPYKCDKCGKSFHHNPGLGQHLREHCRRDETRIIWKCPVCSKVLHYRSKELHMISHYGDPIACPICKKVSKNKISLRAHLKTHKQKE